MHACRDSLGSFHTEEAANAFSANLKSRLRLLFAELLTHTREMGRETWQVSAISWDAPLWRVAVG